MASFKKMGGASVIADAIHGLNATVMDVERLLALAEIMPNNQEVGAVFMVLCFFCSFCHPVSTCYG
jgi:hypothetical protein